MPPHIHLPASLGPPTHPHPPTHPLLLQIPVTCNDVRGLVYLDQQVVGCYCPTCEARVASGHDRPLFSFTRFERHCGSKAKKWRLSLRIEPGTVKECPPGGGGLGPGLGFGLVLARHWQPTGGGARLLLAASPLSRQQHLRPHWAA